jgi:hypothetical protein
MQPAQTTAQVLIFPLERVRPGVRQRLYALRREILRTQEDQSWVTGNSDITPDFVAGLIPSLQELFKAHDDEIADIATQVTILWMHAAQSQATPPDDLRAELLDLQRKALEMEENYNAKRTA